MPTWEPFGRHRYYRENDLAFFEMHGETSLQEMQLVFEVCDVVIAEHGYTLAVFDARAGTSLGPEARRYAGERSRTNNTDGASAIIGANAVVRTIVQLLHNATRLLGSKVSPTYFCATPDDAFRWLAGQRVRLRSLRDSAHT